MSADMPNFALWSDNRLAAQDAHLAGILITMAGQDHPMKAQMRAELAAIRTEIARRPDDPEGE